MSVIQDLHQAVMKEAILQTKLAKVAKFKEKMLMRAASCMNLATLPDFQILNHLEREQEERERRRKEREYEKSMEESPYIETLNGEMEND